MGEVRTLRATAPDGAEHRIAIYEPFRAAARPLKILVIKLDHVGDLLIGLPALVKLRKAFPRDHITLPIWSPRKPSPCCVLHPQTSARRRPPRLNGSGQVRRIRLGSPDLDRTLGEDLWPASTL
jgi:hypothetical protein